MVATAILFSAIAAEAYRVGPRGRQPLLLGIDHQTQCFQCFNAQNGLINFPDQDCRWGFAAINL
jgi:hypothetical protein